MKQGTRFLFLLLVAANAQKLVEENSCNSKLTQKLSQIENEQMFDNFRMKAVIDRILQSVDAINKKMEDLMKQGQSINDCQRTLATWSLIERMNATLFFKAMGRTFYYNRTVMTWKETRDWCSSRGMHLATLKTTEETKQVANALTSKTSPSKGFWVSASDIGRSSGQFHWADGTRVLNSTWGSGRPNYYKANQETCTYISTGYEKLYDYRCSGTWLTLCEVPELLATCL